MTCTIGLVYDLRSDYLKEGYTLEQIAELDTEATIEALDATLQALGHATDRIGHARALCARLVRGDRWDLVFNIAEGLRGRSREAQAPAILELYGVPYVFSDPLVLAATLDKAVAKRLVRSHGLPTPNFKVVASLSEAVPDGLRFPLSPSPSPKARARASTSARASTARRSCARRARGCWRPSGSRCCWRSTFPDASSRPPLSGRGERRASSAPWRSRSCPPRPGRFIPSR